MKKRLINVVSVVCIASTVMSGGAVYAKESSLANHIYELDYIGGNFTASETEEGTTFAGSTCVDRAIRFMKVFMPDFKLPESQLPEIEVPGLGGTLNPDSDTNSPGTDKPGTEEKPEVNNPENIEGSISAQARRIAELVNEERSEAGLQSLGLSSDLSKVAQAKAEDMRDNGYFSHTSPTYGSPFDMMTQFGIRYKAAGENIAKGQKTPESVMNAWMNSSGHRANILNASYEQIGIGYCTDTNGNTYWVQMFVR